MANVTARFVANSTTVRFVQNRTTVRFGACGLSATAFAAYMENWGASLPEHSSDDDAMDNGGLEYGNFYKASAEHETAQIGTLIFLTEP